MLASRREYAHRIREERGNGLATHTLNAAQRKAGEHGDGPLLVIAGAGTGKTMVLAHRVAALIDRGVKPGRILLLTFTRRAAGEMLRRVDGLLKAGTSAAQAMLDYDDLLLCFRSLLRGPRSREIIARFDHVLVDEY